MTTAPLEILVPTGALGQGMPRHLLRDGKTACGVRVGSAWDCEERPVGAITCTYCLEQRKGDV